MKILGNLLALVLSLQVMLSLAEEPTKIQFDPNSASSKEHLKDDLSGVIDKNPDDMTVEEMQFHYFREHDYNNDQMLDGNELVASILHHEMNHDGRKNEAAHKFNEDILIDMIDSLLKMQDKNNDGKLSYEEYIAGAIL